MYMTNLRFNSQSKRRVQITQTNVLLTIFFFSLSQETFNLQTLLLQVTNLNTFPKGPMNEEPWIQVIFVVQF